MTITRANTVERNRHSVVAEASDLGLRPGRWPLFLETDLGNGRPFYVQCQFAGGVTYFQLDSALVLNIFND